MTWGYFLLGNINTPEQVWAAFVGNSSSFLLLTVPIRLLWQVRLYQHHEVSIGRVWEHHVRSATLMLTRDTF
jgi:hypothetical protein